MKMLEQLDSITFYSNTLTEWLLAAGATLLVIFLLHIGRNLTARYLIKAAQKTTTNIDDYVITVLGGTKFLFLLIVGLWCGAKFLTLPSVPESFLATALPVAFIIQAALWINSFIQFWVSETMRLRREEDAASVSAFGAINFFARLVLWSVTVLLLLDNLGFDITTLVAGLGVGSIAVALAVQNILGDIFSSITIILDKPFQVGDFIVVDNYMGVVDKIGIKTTRITSLQGEQIVMPNADLLGSRIQNFRRMQERRIAFTLGVTYQTTKEQLEKIPGIIREIIQSTEETRFDRSHFKTYGDFSLNFETVYYVLTRDYAVYMDVQQKINLAIFERFEAEGIEFAYPTQTLFLEKSNAS